MTNRRKQSNGQFSEKQASRTAKGGLLVQKGTGCYPNCKENDMPRGFGQVDRWQIKSKLIDAGRREIARIGFRALNIDRMAEQAGISKGSFYSFFPSKAMFIVGVLDEIEMEVRQKLFETIDAPSSNPRDLIARFLRFEFDILEKEPVYSLLADLKETAYLALHIPPEQLDRMRIADDQKYGDIFDRWRECAVLGSVSKDAFLDLPRAFLAIFQQKDRFHENRYTALVDLFVESLTNRLAC